jgi:histidine phosphotransferase ChpT
MADILELKATDLAAMLCSRVCHDLINPVGAIGNGLEVLEDPTQSSMHADAQDLIVKSTKHARAKLEYARVAYGASSTAGTDLDTRECERVAKLLFETEKPNLDWQVAPMLLPKHKAKLMMNMLLIALAGVPRGGIVRVEVVGPAGDESITITASSDPEQRQKTLMPMGVEGFLSGKPDEEVTARSIQPFYTGILARMVGLELKIGIEGDVMSFTAQPAAAAGAEAA